MKAMTAAAVLLLGAVLPAAAQQPQAEPTPPDVPVRRNVFTNQMGYLTNGAKWFVVEGLGEGAPETFSLIDVGKGRELSGKLRRVSGDFGTYHVGEFSKCNKPGKYQIWVGLSGKTLSIASHIFRIAHDINDDVVAKSLEFFAVQRCGPSKTGYNGPCHLDDAKRTDNGKSVDLVGGWHNSSGLNKWVAPSVASMPGLLNTAVLMDDAGLRSRIYEEVRWGNLYLHKLQDPAGYIYSAGVGGDRAGPLYANRWTDNIPGNKDDRQTNLRGSNLANQHVFIWTQAMVAHAYGDVDPDYAALGLDKARRCFQWVIDTAAKRGNRYAYYDTGSGISAGLQMFRATKEEKYKQYALDMAERFVAFQEQEWIGNQKQVRGFFYENSERKNGVFLGLIDPLSLIAFCEIIEALPKHPKNQSWRQALEMHVRDCTQVMAARNAFGLVPRGVHLRKPTKPSQYSTGRVPVDRKVGDLGYRYFATTSGGARSSYRAGLAVALFKAARLLDRPECAAIAQRQLDWLFGANPFGISLVIGFGHVPTPEYVFTGFQPRTPWLPGTPLQGIFADEYDRPDMMPGHYVSSEPWIIHNAFLMWALAEAKVYNNTCVQ